MMGQKQKTAFVCSNGCPENLMDCGLARKYLVLKGWDIADNPEESEAILFNACGLTEEHESDSLDKIKALQALSKAGSLLLVWGCLPKIHPEALQAVYKEPRLGEMDPLLQMDALTQAECRVADITNNDCSPTHFATIDRSRGMLSSLTRLPARRYIEAEKRLNLYRPGSHIYYIKISSGCLGQCTYCAVRLSRGTVRSKSLQAIVSEFKAGLARGYQEFSLMGTDLGCYGRDVGYTLCDLLQELVKENGNYKIGIRNSNPAFMKQLIDRLEPILKTGKIWFLGLPIESGSNRILRLMGRRYTVEEYRDYYQRLKAAWPELVIRNQMMVGFPGETERDFAASMKLIQELGIDFNEVYCFSARPGTAAAKLKGQLPGPVKNLRYYRMLIRILWKHREILMKSAN
jgi:threonylcarbamoyladenosine tRNA methylthiotransferase CDKAL1